MKLAILSDCSDTYLRKIGDIAIDAGHVVEYIPSLIREDGSIDSEYDLVLTDDFYDEPWSEVNSYIIVQDSNLLPISYEAALSAWESGLDFTTISIRKLNLAGKPCGKVLNKTIKITVYDTKETILKDMEHTSVSLLNDFLQSFNMYHTLGRSKLC